MITIVTKTSITWDNKSVVIIVDVSEDRIKLNIKSTTIFFGMAAIVDDRSDIIVDENVN